MNELKYIINTNGNYMIFSNSTYHSTAYRAMQRHDDEPCAGAGFISLNGGSVHCWGRSESLNIPCRPGVDAVIIAKNLGLEARR